MEKIIKENIEDPLSLEKSYHSDKTGFKKAFFSIYPEISTSKLAAFWKVRLEYDDSKETQFSISPSDILFLVLSCVIVGVLIKIPVIFGFNPDESMFYEKNAVLIVFLGLSGFTYVTLNRYKRKHLFVTLISFIVCALYVNILPVNPESSSIILVYIHLPLLLWCLYGLVYIDFDYKNLSERFNFIKHNGDLAILGALIAVAGMALSGLTFGLFQAIDLNIEEFYANYVIIWGAVSAPIVATFIVRNFPVATTKIANILATIFSPLVLITLVVYLVSIMVTGKDPYNDRDFLIIFNVMLLAVMAIIVFSISEVGSSRVKKFSEITLFLLVIMALIIDLVALSAIIYRLNEFGFTPNRTAVVVSNLLIFGNLIVILINLYKANFRNGNIRDVELTVSRYLPIYMIWTIVVVFIFPLIFGMK